MEAERLLIAVAAYCIEHFDDFVDGVRDGSDGLAGDAALAADFEQWVESLDS